MGKRGGKTSVWRGDPKLAHSWEVNNTPSSLPMCMYGVEVDRSEVKEPILKTSPKVTIVDMITCGF